MMDGGSGVGMGPEAGLPFTPNPYNVDTSCPHSPSVDFHEPLLPIVAATGGERLPITTKTIKEKHTHTDRRHTQQKSHLHTQWNLTVPTAKPYCWQPAQLPFH